MGRQPKFAVIDSGSGGLTILNEIINRRLSCDLIYVADNEKYPYGMLSEQDVSARVIAIVEYLYANENIDGCIIACNTASTIVLPELRKRWQLPFVGVVPAIKPAAKLTKSGSIGVLATPATVSRSYLEQLIKDFANDKNVVSLGSNILVEQAEALVQSNDIDLTLIKGEIEKLLIQNPSVDTLVLACTHFPLLKAVFEEILMGKNIQLLDSTSAIVNRLETLFPKINTRTTNKKQCKFLTGSERISEKYAGFIGDLSAFDEYELHCTKLAL